MFETINAKDLKEGDIIACVGTGKASHTFWVVGKISDEGYQISSVGEQAEERAKELNMLIKRLVGSDIILPTQPLAEYKTLTVSAAWFYNRNIILIKRGNEDA